MTRLTNSTTTVIQHLARQLLAAEAVGPAVAEAVGVAAARTCERLRVPLTKLAGAAGFRSLMARALALAIVESPALAIVQVKADGSLDGLQHLKDHQDGGQAGFVVVAQLLGLLVTFIGEPLTLGIVRDAWPNASITGMDAGSAEER
ncbi:hypothetical protein [Zavarzinella formosa]|uniref:hypothetical protein n=1 Tax=Zavarzinella formosa TaxID=360055 RepID=UPI000371699A|nr:hypothetical protein [Zavarzinella formosa]